MIPSVHLLNIHMYLLFHLINSQTSDKWKLKRLKNITSVYRKNNHDKFNNLDYPAISKSSNVEHKVNNNSKSVVQMSLLKTGNYSVKTKEYSELSHPDCGLKTNKFIVGGKEVIDDSYPWVGGLMIDGVVRCCANIINEWWILTAAHCYFDIPGPLTPDRFSITVGSSDQRKGNVYMVSKIIAHDHDSGGNNERDIAVMKINGPIKWSRTVKPICLPKQSYLTPKKGKLLTVTGWGVLHPNAKRLPSKMREVELKVIPIEKCAELWGEKRKKIYKSQICTHDVGKDACHGDSGGPAIDIINGRATVVGLVSYGKTCADQYPGVFTKVSYYINWIKRAIESR